MSSMPRNLPKLIFHVADYYRESVSETVIDFWTHGLAKFSFEEIQVAFERWMRTNDRMPRISNIGEILQGDGSGRALAALLTVEKAMDEHGAYATVVFDDPAIHATIQSLGGWIKACRQTEYEFTWWKKDFRERYQMIDQRGLPPDVPLKLFGLFDQTNLPMGRPPQTPRLIGDPGKIREWVARVEEPRSLESRSALLSMVRSALPPIPNDAA